MRKGLSLTTASPGMSETPPMSSRGSKSGRAFLRSRDTPVVWIPEANEDLLEARAWYDNIRPQLGEHFALAVDATKNIGTAVTDLSFKSRKAVHLVPIWIN
jgi:hypothetical protein